MNRLILLTTAITRGNLHRDTIGHFYKLHYPSIQHLEIYHIINIDHPDKLKNVFNRDETVELFNQIIPKNVKKEFILTEEPGFAKAYKNVLDKAERLVDKNTIVWWLEDDWYIQKYFNIKSLLKLLDINNSALSITNNAPLCSFRAGPIMSHGFYKNIFDIHKYIGNNVDPEYKVNKSLRTNRILKTYDDVFIVCIYIESLFKGNISFNESCPWYYNRKMRELKFNQGKKIRKLVCLMESPDSEKIYHKEIIDYFEPLSTTNFKNGSSCITIEKLKDMLKDSFINYITIVPHMFKDAGRFFNAHHKLVKNGVSYD